MDTIGLPISGKCNVGDIRYVCISDNILYTYKIDSIPFIHR